MFNWTIKPNSRISKIDSPIIRNCALLLREMKNLVNHIIHFPRKKWKNYPSSRYNNLLEDEYNKTVELGVLYINAAEVVGDIVEFGTQGLTATTICKLLGNYPMKSKRTIHLFDSFEGYPKATLEEDLNSPHIKSKSLDRRRCPYQIYCHPINEEASTLDSVRANQNI